MFAMSVRPRRTFTQRSALATMTRRLRWWIPKEWRLLRSKAYMRNSSSVTQGSRTSSGKSPSCASGWRSLSRCAATSRRYGIRLLA